MFNFDIKKGGFYVELEPETDEGKIEQGRQLDMVISGKRPPALTAEALLWIECLTYIQAHRLFKLSKRVNAGRANQRDYDSYSETLLAHVLNQIEDYVRLHNLTFFQKRDMCAENLRLMPIEFVRLLNGGEFRPGLEND